MRVPATETFLDPVLLARISDLPLIASTVVEGFMHGLHRSARKGLSLDFAEHRQYQPGDDLRRIDWKAFARTDRFYIKEYEADTNAGVVIALDVSASMDYSGSAESVNKFRYAGMLAASLAWLAQKQGDRIGLATFAERLVEVVPPSTRHLQLLLHALGRARAEGEGQLGLALDRVADVMPRPGMIVLISDCYENPEKLIESVQHLRARGHDVLVFHLVDHVEETFPFDGALVFEDSETALRYPLRPNEIRERYLKLFAEHKDELETRLAASGVDYELLRTNQPLDFALYRYLDKRLSKGRVR